MALTPRLQIETLGPQHAAPLFGPLQDARIYTYIPEQPYTSVAALAARYAHLAKGSPDPAEQWLNWALFLRGSHEVVGTLQATVMPDARVAEVAYVLCPAYWKQGYATEALTWLLAFLKASGAVEAVRAQIDLRNTASLTLAHRLGFVLSETVGEGDQVDGVLSRSI